MTSPENSQPNPNLSVKCAHAGCRCSVPPGQEYCSGYCENMIGADTCNCGHTECKGSERGGQ
jgi:hypothetical protein